MPPAPPKPVPDTLADSEHPIWQRGDIFRAVFFGALALIYAVLLFPLTVAAVAIWLLGKVLDRGGGTMSGAFGRPQNDAGSPR